MKLKLFIVLKLFCFVFSSSIKLRDFTLQQLETFNGIKNKEKYFSYNNIVYNITSLSSDSSHSSSDSLNLNEFSGKEITTIDINNNPNSNNLQDLFQSLQIVGYLSLPETNLKLNKKELSKYIGIDNKLPDRVHPQVFVAINRRIFDVSYGGFHLYGPGGSYSIFAGKDASRALAKMSFEPDDINSSNLHDLTEEQRKSLDGWFTSFQKYPIVGTLI